MKTYSLRSEGLVDIARFIIAIHDAGLTMSHVRIQTMKYGTPPRGLPDTTLEFLSDSSVTQLRDVIRTVQDGHVMLQTLQQPESFASNSLNRNYDLQ